MTIKLSREMQEIVEKKLESGKFATPSEVVLAGLRRLPQEMKRRRGGGPFAISAALCSWI